MKNAYLYQPTLGEKDLFFVSDNSLWSVPIEGGTAKRLIVGEGLVYYPTLSPDGKHITFSFTEEGSYDIYVMSLSKGNIKRLTFNNSICMPVGWANNSKEIFFRSPINAPSGYLFEIFKISINGGNYVPLNLGQANWINIHKDNNQTLIGKFSVDLSRWKRYRGGMAGTIWYGNMKELNFKEILKDKAGHVLPQFSGDRIIYLTDKNGVSNIYSSDTSGEDVKQHTFSKDYYIRNISVKNNRVVYQMAGNLYLLDLTNDKSEKINIDITSPFNSEKNYFVVSNSYINDFDIFNDGQESLFTVRGKMVSFPNWTGAMKIIGTKQGTRYRLTKYLNDDGDIITVSDEGGEEKIEIHYKSYLKEKVILGKVPEGLVWHLFPSNYSKKIAVGTNRKTLYIIDVENKEWKPIDTCKSVHGVNSFSSISWSPDDRYITYSKVDKITTSIFIYDVVENELIRVTDEEYYDYNPVFDPDGKYLYFASNRYLNPYIDHIDVAFTYICSAKPYLITLKKDTPLPFYFPHKLEQGDKKGEDDNKEGKSDGKKEEKVVKVEIDKDGITNRIYEFPVSAAPFYKIEPLKDKVILVSDNINGLMEWYKPESNTVKLDIYDFIENKSDSYLNNVSGYKISRNNKWIIYKSKDKYNVRKIREKSSDKKDDKSSRQNGGMIETNKIKIKVELQKEWKQIFNEVWTLGKEFYWDENLSGIDWEVIKAKYEPLLEKINTREELSDLLWELQGEFGTSHAYVFGGDLQKTKGYNVGLLGANFVFDEDKGKYKIAKIYKGDTFISNNFSPLLIPGVNIEEGEYILAINGEEIEQSSHPYEKLINMAETEIVLTMSKTGNIEDAREVTVKTIKSETPLLYRDWVNENKKYVSDKTNDEVGYFHIPDMSLNGLKEFDRYFYQNIYKKGIIIDARWNGGGSVSQYILQKLYRQLVGFINSRWVDNEFPETLPNYTFRGSLVVMIDENAGSDGDIFPQSFKNLKMGTVVGKRTWGGVVGISGARLGSLLVDKGGSTQPEYHIWFKEQKYDVENYGVDPHVEVDNDPKSVFEGKDNQLDVSIEEIKKLIEKNGYYIPDFTITKKKMV